MNNSKDTPKFTLFLVEKITINKWYQWWALIIVFVHQSQLVVSMSCENKRGVCA